MFAYFSQARFQATPSQKTCDSTLAQSPHPGVINVGMADASIRAVAATVSPQTWWAACTPNDGDMLGSDW
jgi:hypothetical protein